MAAVRHLAATHRKGVEKPMDRQWPRSGKHRNSEILKGAASLPKRCCSPGCWKPDVSHIRKGWSRANQRKAVGTHCAGTACSGIGCSCRHGEPRCALLKHGVPSSTRCPAGRGEAVRDTSELQPDPEGGDVARGTSKLRIHPAPVPRSFGARKGATKGGQRRPCASSAKGARSTEALPKAQP